MCASECVTSRALMRDRKVRLDEYSIRRLSQGRFDDVGDVEIAMSRRREKWNGVDERETRGDGSLRKVTGRNVERLNKKRNVGVA